MSIAYRHSAYALECGGVSCVGVGIAKIEGELKQKITPYGKRREEGSRAKGEGVI
jgi:hypothetical protein